MQEIERKFLIKGDYKQEATKAYRIAQGYLNNGGPTVRVRIRDDKGFLTIKGHASASGLSRFEWEKEIPVDEAQQLLQLAQSPVVDKTRYLVPNTDGRHTWEVDEFHGDNEGLTVAEVELTSEDDTFDKPEWLGGEVTGDRRYYNSVLARCPFKTW